MTLVRKCNRHLVPNFWQWRETPRELDLANGGRTADLEDLHRGSRSLESSVLI